MYIIQVDRQTDREIATEPLAQQLSSLMTHTGCVAAREEEDDLDYASGRGHMRISLAPAIEFVEAQILGHFRVAIPHEANVLRSLPGILARDHSCHIDHCNPWWRFICRSKGDDFLAQQ